MIIEMLGTSWIEAISSYPLKIHFLHQIFEEERIKGIELNISRLYCLTVSNLHLIVLTIKICFVSLIILNQSVSIDIAIAENIKLKVFNDLFFDTSQNLSLNFTIDRDFWIESYGIFLNTLDR